MTWRVAVAALAIGCHTPAAKDVVPASRADVVLRAPAANEGPYGDPALATNGVRGGGATSGSLDVYRLGAAPNGLIELAWSAGVVCDGDGYDLIVFENPFQIAGGGLFIDPALVEVSPDGVDWVAFPVAYTGPPDIASDDPADWVGFAGLSPVFLHEDNTLINPLDHAAAGGDAFDLADLPGDDPVTLRVQQECVAAVRITSAHGAIDAMTGAPYPTTIISDGADIDGVYAFITPR